MDHQASECPLCGANEVASFFTDANRNYLRCDVCSLVFVPKGFHLVDAAERAEYDRHENSPDDPGYRRFLSRVFEPIALRLEPNSAGLDFGSGPGPTLSVMFEEAGHQVALFDKFYAPDESVFSQSYDFVTASEVVEHLRSPREELDRIWSCVRPGGWLGIMTKRVLNSTAFAGWHYKNDLTHVSFFAESTFQWLARLWQAELTVCGDDVVLFQKPETLDIVDQSLTA